MAFQGLDTLQVFFKVFILASSEVLLTCLTVLPSI